MGDILLEKRKIGCYTIKNPVMGAPLNMRPYGQLDGVVTENHIKLYQEYSESGFGVIVSDAVNINEMCQHYRAALGCWDDKQIPGLRILAQTLKKRDMLAILQIAHRGQYCFDVETIEEISASKLVSVQKDFIDAAERAQKAGFDGVELHGCHAYLLSQILSPITNSFEWEYGGSLEKRAQYVIEIIRAIKEKCGKTFVVGVRMGCNEPDLTSSIQLAKYFEQAGADYLSISVGTSFPVECGRCDESFSWETVIPENFHYGKRLFGAWKIKQNVSIPVASVADIRKGETARDILENGYVDFIAIGRARLADPDWYKKIISGQEPSYCLTCRTCMWFSDPQKCPARHRLYAQEKMQNENYINSLKIKK